MKKGFLDTSNRRVRMKDENVSIAAKVLMNKDSERTTDPVENRMTTELKSLIKRILTGNFGSEDMSKHMLHGMFKQLMDKETFADILFPGASESVQRDLPMNLKDLLSWDILSLDLSKIAGKAASIFNGIKSKGEIRGDFMDSTTEAILMPQIVEEAMAREVVETVRNLSKRVSGLNARVSLALATPTEEEGSWDQIGSEVSDALSSSECALGVQNKFLGTEWSTLVLEDVIRFAADEKMTSMSNETSILNCPIGYPTDSHSRCSKPSDASISRMAWIEEDTVSESYPALGELLQQLHALPYEINGKPCRAMQYHVRWSLHIRSSHHTEFLQPNVAATDLSPFILSYPTFTAKSNCALLLLQPARGCTMMVHFAHGSVQPPRRDNKENEFDSGIRVTCAYHLVPCEGVYIASTSGSESKHDHGHDDVRHVVGQEPGGPSPGPIAELLYSIVEVSKESNEHDKDKDKDKDKGQQESSSSKLLPRNLNREDMKALAVEHDQ